MSVCPRCGAGYEEPFAALSRWDDRTLVCPGCGTHEAVLQFCAESSYERRRFVHPVMGLLPWVHRPNEMKE